ncbi:hypothetical protein [Streptomyces muensis]|uniref:Secreted protein n=1 Tax=Streptomyces muensis TaxID=1077944 RepID=A0A9X1PTB4_STRM4|nr:hypothetical protein [Streptomyces muensis]MCF1592174.1 hypothetical protein [Streptomyces muensis]
MIRKMSVAAATLGAATALMLGGAGLASAGTAGSAGASGETRAQAAPCWHSGSHWWCNNRVGAPVLEANTGQVVGYMNSNPSWFVCRQEGNPTGGGGPHPNRWVWTTADNGKKGWMRDSDISSETNSLPTC